MPLTLFIFLLITSLLYTNAGIDNPILVKPLVYHLKLEDECHYVGITYNLNQRYAQHLGGNGAKWTQLHKPIDVQKVWIDGSEELENKITLELIEKYGKEKVRGGKYTQTTHIVATNQDNDNQDNSGISKLDKIMEFKDYEWVQKILSHSSWGPENNWQKKCSDNLIKIDNMWFYKGKLDNEKMIEVKIDRNEWLDISPYQCYDFNIIATLYKIHNEDFNINLLPSENRFNDIWKLMILYNRFRPN